MLFLKYMMDSLRPGGRCGVVVPEGVLFGSTGAHKELRRQLIESNRVEAVLSLPGGVFQPYSGVKTSVLFFRKGGATDQVLFLHADNDGYKLDATTTRRSTTTTSRLIDDFRRRDPVERSGARATRRTSGRQSGGSPQPRSEPTTSISRPGAIDRQVRRPSSIVIREKFWTSWLPSRPK